MWLYAEQDGGADGSLSGAICVALKLQGDEACDGWRGDRGPLDLAGRESRGQESTDLRQISLSGTLSQAGIVGPMQVKFLQKVLGAIGSAASDRGREFCISLQWPK